MEYNINFDKINFDKILENLSEHPPIHSFIGVYPVTQLWNDILGEYITVIDYPNKL